MIQPVTQEMRKLVSDALVREMSGRGLLEEGPLHFSENLTRVIHHELTRDDDDDNPTTTISEFADLLLDESCEEESVHEYVALQKHFNPEDNTFTSLMLLRGLHRHRRNRDWMDPDDPASVRRTTALLRAMVFIRKSRSGNLLDDALAYVDYGDQGHYEQSFKDAEVADLIIDNPEQYETLFALMQERGYQHGITVFRDMMRNGVHALSIGVL